MGRRAELWPRSGGQNIKGVGILERNTMIIKCKFTY